MDSDGSAANAGLILETSESAISSLPELETDLLESTGDHMNSLLLQVNRSFVFEQSLYELFN